MKKFEKNGARPKGIILIDTIKKLNIDLFKTRNIEFSKKLKQVNKNELSLEALVSEISQEIGETVSKIVEIEKIENKPNKEIIGTCPRCGKKVYQGKTKTNKVNYYCEGYREGCKFTLWEETKHYKNPIKVTKSKAKSLLKENGTAKFIIGKIEKKLKLKLNGIYINFEEQN